MTRTARKSTKKEPLPATPWEELKQPYRNQNEGDDKLRKVKRQGLKVTHKKKLGLKFSEKTKTKLKRITSKQLKRLPSDNIRLLECLQSSEGTCTCDPTHEEVVNGTQEKSRKPGKKKGTADRVHGLDVIQTAEIKSTPKTHKKQKLVSSVHKSKRKRSTRSENKVPLLGSDSESGLSNKEAGCDDDDEEDIRESEKSGSDKGEVDEEGSCKEGYMEGKEDAVVTCKKKNAKRKKASKRIKVGKRWVKDFEPGANGGTVSDGGREGGAVAVRNTDDERRRKRIEQRRLRRQRKKVCFSCRQPGHWVGDCPLNSTSAGICFKCGSSEHTCQQCRVKVPSGEFPYAKCFICSEVGHLSRSCPDNPRGLYPRGGGCKVCGSVEHLKANCPLKNSSNENSIPSDSTTSENACSADAIVRTDVQKFTTSTPPKRKSEVSSRRKEKVVKF